MSDEDEDEDEIFTLVEEDEDSPGSPSLRDYFAAHALGGLLSGGAHENRDGSIDEVTGMSYDYADSMIRSREY
jgi:hypothetical protein